VSSTTVVAVAVEAALVPAAATVAAVEAVEDN